MKGNSFKIVAGVILFSGLSFSAGMNRSNTDKLLIIDSAKVGSSYTIGGEKVSVTEKSPEEKGIRTIFSNGLEVYTECDKDSCENVNFKTERGYVEISFERKIMEISPAGTCGQKSRKTVEELNTELEGINGKADVNRIINEF